MRIPVLFIAGSLCALACLRASPALGQVLTTAVDSPAPGSHLVTFEFSWPQSLSDQVDSLGITGLTPSALSALSNGVLLTSENITLATGAAPSFVTVRESEFDELALPAPGDSIPSVLLTPTAEVVGIGMMRKEYVGSVQVRVVDYDRERGVLRRYRRIVVDVNESLAAVSRSTTQSVGGFSPRVQNRATKSVLADGQVFKIPITDDGIYRVTRQLLVELGLQPDSIDPNRVRVFSNGGAPVPASNGDPRIDDLAELPVTVDGGGDGSFAAGDGVVFFGQGPTGWIWDESDLQYEHYVNPFDLNSYVFVKVGVDVNKQLASPGLAPASPDATFNESTGRFFVDFDESNWSKDHGSGLTWVSNPIQTSGRLDVLTNQDLPGAVAGDLQISGVAAISSNPVTSVVFSRSGETVATVRAAFGISSRSDQPTTAASPFQFSLPHNGGPLNLQMRVVEQINGPSASLDYLRVLYPRNNTAANGLLRLHSEGVSGVVEHVLSGFSEAPVVLDVTDQSDIRRLDVWPSGSSFRTQVTVTGANPRELVAFAPSSAQELTGDQSVEVATQNLHGITSFPDYVVFSPAELMVEANDYATYRRRDGLVIEVVDMAQVFNEFSGGQVDMRATRDYLKFLYDRATDDATLLRYALFFGDGHFDFRKLRTGIEQGPNFIPPYATTETFNPDASFTSDDYFGLLDDDEGEWRYRGYGVSTTERLDIGIGRLPVKTPAEARAVFEKIKRYEDPATFGAWRARYTYVADDAFSGSSGATDEGDLHMYNMDSVAEYVRANVFDDIDVRKVYADSFDRIFLNEAKIPGARDAILNSIEDGTLIVNYSGHGGPSGLAQEDLFTRTDATELTNSDRLAVFITATCSFGWWDIDDFTSGAEELLLNPSGGSVAMFTTVRLVYTSASPTDLNPGLNRALNVALFERDENGLPVRFGDAMVQTKNSSVGLLGNSRKFNLLGDPTMRLGIPAASVVVDKINDVQVSDAVGQMRALDRVQLSGQVRTHLGQPDATFDGTITLTVFDAKRRVPIKKYRWMPNRYYEVREDLLWRGDVRVEGGLFAAEFVVPKDISYSNQLGRITAYARNETEHALGYTDNFIVGGTSENPPNDARGPTISLFLNDTTFVSGGMVGADAELIARFSDESGINTVGSGVGHEVLLVLNNEEAKAVDISSSFVSDENSYQNGTIRWKLDELPNGPNRLAIRAWDVLNNSGASELEFFVVEGEDLTVRNVYNYPNPMSRRTRFLFEHNQPSGTPAKVQIRIYSLNGVPLRTINTDEALPLGTLTAGPVQVEWDGRDDDFDRVATGIYLYKVRLEVDTVGGDHQVVERVEKIAVIR